MTRSTNGDLAALVGNGMSIAFNRDLAIPNLTNEIKKRFKTIDPAREAPDRVLARLAARAHETGDPHKDFEALIGPLDQQSENLKDLRDLAELVAEESRPVAAAIRTVDDFVKVLQRQGKGDALDLIQTNTYAGGTQPIWIIDDFIEAMIQTASGKVAIGNLNYDSLALAGLCHVDPAGGFCDMANGWRTSKFDLLGQGIPMLGAEIRTTPDFPSRRVRLLHLHGSATWLRKPGSSSVFKFQIDDLRSIDYWAAWRDGLTNWSPEVVLTNQSAKSSVVARPPFALAYDVFYESLRTADRWLIAGYSFRDGCVNELLAKAWRNRPGQYVPEVLVVTYGKEPTRSEILDAIGWDPENGTDVDNDSWLHICRHGIADAPECRTWQKWEHFGMPQVA